VGNPTICAESSARDEGEGRPAPARPRPATASWSARAPHLPRSRRRKASTRLASPAGAQSAPASEWPTSVTPR